MKRLSAAGVLLAIPTVVAAQPVITTEPERLSLYAEFLQGNAMVVVCCSLNADWMVDRHTSFRVGWGTGILTDNDTTITSSLAMVNRLIGDNGRYIEVGAGIVRSNTGYVAQKTSRVGPTVALGYRVQRGGKLTRVTFTPMLNPFAGLWKSRRLALASFGISRGWSF